MNERIEKLRGQTLRWSGENVNRNLYSNYEIEQKEYEKFARLIVRECAELSVNSQYANNKSEYYEGFNEALVYVGNKIKEHFGVEE